jgi:Cu/Ag efflux protein CusF
MSRFARVVLVASFAVSLAACALFDDRDGAAAAPLSGVVREDQITSTATVEKIDLASRVVTLKGENGKTFTVKAGEAVRNLPQVKVGDQVVTTYYESLAYSVHKPGSLEAGATAAVGAARAEPGEKPGAIAANVVQVVATIVAIDKATPSVTLKKADGEVVAIRVREPRRLEGVAVGDMVEITYSEALAIAVQPAPAE